ncbi:hypothetical protein TcBrA4_0005240 [Trypanosoma cruzi]|nr:hypothetical protein TcBrA4_0005240 [Trypanosoma cruzi]
MPELEAMPSYLPDTVVLQLHRDDGEAEFAHYMDANSLTFVALGDAERPVLCGINAAAQLHYGGAHRRCVIPATVHYPATVHAAVRCANASLCLCEKWGA